MDTNRLSLIFDHEVNTLNGNEKRGSELIPLFLDHILEDSCSPEVKEAFDRALRRFYNFPVQKETKGEQA